MAFIPDEAVLRSHEISPAAFRLYAYYCIRRNKNTGGYNCAKSRVLSELSGMSEPSFFRARKELVASGWIEAERDYVVPIMGFKTINSDSETIKNESARTIKNESETINSDSETIKNDRKTIKNDSAYKEYQPTSHIPANYQDPPTPHTSGNESAEPDSKEQGHNGFVYPMLDLLTAFPDLILTPAQVGMIEAEVKDTKADKAAWLATIKRYQANHNPATRTYLPEKVGNLLGVFRSERKNVERDADKSKPKSRRLTDQEMRNIGL